MRHLHRNYPKNPQLGAVTPLLSRCTAGRCLSRLGVSGFRAIESGPFSLVKLIRERMARRSGLLAPLAAAIATSAALLLTIKPCGSLAFAPAALAPAGTPGCISQCSSAGCAFGGFVAEGPCLGGRAIQAVPGTPICGAVYMAAGGRSGGGRGGGKRGGGGKARGGKTGPSPRAGKKRGGRGSTGGGRGRDPDDDGYMEPQGRRITEMERVRTRLPRSHPCSCTAPAPAPRHVPQGAQIGR